MIALCFTAEKDWPYLRNRRWMAKWGNPNDKKLFHQICHLQSENCTLQHIPGENRPGIVQMTSLPRSLGVEIKENEPLLVDYVYPTPERRFRVQQAFRSVTDPSEDPNAVEGRFIAFWRLLSDLGLWYPTAHNPLDPTCPPFVGGARHS
jgi:hypothetical protein